MSDKYAKYDVVRIPADEVFTVSKDTTPPGVKWYVSFSREYDDAIDAAKGKPPGAVTCEGEK